MKMGIVKLMMTQRATNSKEQMLNSVICKGIALSIMSMSNENLFNILPKGLLSKNIIGLLITDLSRASCRCLATVEHFQ